MRKTYKQLLALVLSGAILMSGCGQRNNNMLSYEEWTTADTEAVSSSSEENTDSNQETNSFGEEESTSKNDVEAGNNLTYNYDFSIYNNGRSFSSEQIKIQSGFEEYLKEFFVDQMTENTITLHFTIENSEKYDIPDFDATWGEVSYEKMLEDEKEEKEYYEKLKTFDYESLTYEQQLIYDMMKTTMENDLSVQGCELFSSAFAPMSGFQGEFPIIFSEYEINDKADMEDYLKLLSTTYEYVKQLCEYEKYRLKEGYSLTTKSLDDVIEQCNEYIEANPNSLKPVFEEIVSDISWLSDKEKEAYIKEFDKAMEKSVIPAYKLIISTFGEIKKSNASKDGLANYENGKKYYEALVRENVGTSKSVDELYKEIEAKMTSYMTNFSLLALKNMDIIDEMTEFEYPTDEPDEMLKLLREKLKEDFPEAATDSYTINYVPESLESTMNPAFYLIPPIDNKDRNIIYINNYDEYASMDLFPTVAHEGFPGHMYQTSYFYSTNPHYFRSVFNYNGYTEGYAHYVENEFSYKYAGASEDLVKAFIYNNGLNYALYCAVDIGGNYYGWTFEETKEYLSKYRGDDDETAKEIFNTMVDEPAVYLRYYGGYLEILDLKEIAEKTLGTGFELKQFHKFLLDIGPCSFDIIEDRMYDWMERVQN